MELLKEQGGRARFLAGGTSLILAPSDRQDVLIDLSRLGLDYINEQADGSHLGAMTTCAALRRYLSHQPPSHLAEAAASVGSRTLQNHVTVGGNCVMAYSWSDLPVALLCAEAVFVLQGQGQTQRQLSADQFFAAHPRRILGKEELLREVVVPRPAPHTGSAYLKIGRNATDQALASVAAEICLEGETVKSARLVVGAVRGLPQMLGGTTLRMQGQKPEPSALALAARQAAEEANISSDFRASMDYRRQLVSSLVEDALQRAVNRAEGRQ